jgi:hypothetical protein
MRSNPERVNQHANWAHMTGQLTHTFSEKPQRTAAEISHACQRGGESIINARRLTAEARGNMAHCELLVVVQADLPFGRGTAGRLMAIDRRPVISKSARAPVLPPDCMTVCKVTQLPDQTLRPRSPTGSDNLFASYLRKQVQRTNERGRNGDRG